MLKFRDRVLIKNGFYADRIGLVQRKKWFGLKYEVECDDNGYFEKWFWKWELKAIRNPLTNDAPRGIYAENTAAYAPSRILPLP